MILEIFNVFFALTVVLITCYMVRHYIFTLTVLRKHNHTESFRVHALHFQPSVTILIPAHNEEKVISKLLQKMTELAYPKEKLEVIVIDDASIDGTGKKADSMAKQFNYIKVLHRTLMEGGRGKPAALNAGLKKASGEIILCFDADYLPNSYLVERLVAEFANPRIGAVQGRPVVLNEPQNFVTRLITLERIGGYRVDQEARNILKLIPQFGGTVGGFRRLIIDAIGGFDESMLTEDTDLTFQVYLEGYTVSYVADAECYEEAVSTWKAYWRQRHRWALGHMQVCFKHFFKVMLSSKLRLRQKIDGLLLLGIYFMPLITFSAFIVGLFLIITNSLIIDTLWFPVILSFYSFVGNYAPFFEVAVGVYLDGRTRVQWLAPLMFFSFIYNVFICGKAFIDLVTCRLIGRKTSWQKTDHPGYGRSYIKNPVASAVIE